MPLTVPDHDRWLLSGAGGPDDPDSLCPRCEEPLDENGRCASCGWMVDEVEVREEVSYDE
jgi:hypothetical protein